MLEIDKDGKVQHQRIKLVISPSIQKKIMSHVSGIIVYQTGGATAQSSFNSYKNDANGAHFLIEKDGTVCQTASPNIKPDMSVRYVPVVFPRCVVPQ